MKSHTVGPLGRGCLMALLGASLLLLALTFALPGPTLPRRLLQAIEGSRSLLQPQGRHQAPLRAPAAAAAAAEAAEAEMPAQLPTCSLDIEASPFARSCTRLEDVCVDQGRAILYGRRLHPQRSGEPPLGMPVVPWDERHAHTQVEYLTGDGHRLSYRWPYIRLPRIRTRPASAVEARRYLQAPRFSSCTVPIVVYEFNNFNFAHIVRDNAAQAYSALAETPWAPHAKLVLVTGGGTAVRPTNRALWQPLSPLRVDSWADFSARLPDEQYGTLPAEPNDGSSSSSSSVSSSSLPGAPPASWEGPELRCFRHLLVCRGFDIKPAELRMHGYGQLLVRHYGAAAAAQQGAQQAGAQLAGAQPWQQQGAAQQPAAEAAAAAGGQAAAPSAAYLLALPPPPPESVLCTLGAGGGSAQQAQQQAQQRAPPPPPPVLLRVAFQRRTRSEAQRQIVNAAELVERCNRWSTRAPSGATVRAVCWEVPLADLPGGMAAAQQADVFVGAHGANLANAYFMRPGSAAIEITPHGFEEHPPHTWFATRNMQDPATRLQWFKLLLCGAADWTPGLHEAVALLTNASAVAAPGDDWSKYRNMVVRWEALETALQAVVDTAGDMAAYRRRWAEGSWWWLSTDAATLPAGPDRKQTCAKARAQGLIP